jgi:hypothetical protein
MPALSKIDNAENPGELSKLLNIEGLELARDVGAADGLTLTISIPSWYAERLSLYK